MKNQWGLRWAFACISMVGATPASANIGLPLVAVFLPPMWVALLPIILVEAVLISRLGRHPLPRTLGATAVANIASTIVGVPLLWFLLATIELVCCGTALGTATPLTKLYAVTIQAPWLIPYESEFWWMVPWALLTMGILCAGMSVIVEAPIVRLILQAPSRVVWRLSAIANVASYVTLGLTGWIFVKAGANFDRLNQLFMPLSEKLVEAVFLIAGWISNGG